jgi:hypothetical protein
LLQDEKAYGEVQNQGNNYTYNVIELDIVHGESDQIAGKTANYANNILQL